MRRNGIELVCSAKASRRLVLAVLKEKSSSSSITFGVVEGKKERKKERESRQFCVLPKVFLLFSLFFSSHVYCLGS